MGGGKGACHSDNNMRGKKKAERGGAERAKRGGGLGRGVNGSLFISSFPHPVNGCRHGHPI